MKRKDPLPAAALLATLLCAAVAFAGCSESVAVIAPEPDAGPATDARPPEDAAAATPSCAVDGGARWSELPAPTRGPAGLSGLTFALAARAPDDVLVGGLDRLQRFDGERLAPFARDGLPDGSRIVGVGWHGEAPVVGLEAASPNVFRWDGDTWVASGDVGDAGSAPIRFVSIGDELLVFTGFELLRHDGGREWSAVFGGRTADVARSDGFVYAAVRAASGLVIRRSADGSAWEDLPSEGTLFADLAAGGGYAFSISPVGAGVRVLDESEATPTFRTPAEPLAEPLVWVGRSGRAVAMRDEVMMTAPTWRGPYTEHPSLRIRPFTNGLARQWDLAETGGFLLALTRLEAGGRKRVVASHPGETFTPLDPSEERGPIDGLVTDGRRLLVLAERADGTRTLQRWTDDGWTRADGDLPPWEEMAGASAMGASGWLITRPGYGATEAPFVSDDGGRTWTEMADGYPQLNSGVGLAYRDFAAFAVDERGRLLVGTVGGITSVPGTAEGTALRPGSGVWRTSGEAWSPLNAGIPIEARPGSTRGPPYRTDVVDGVSTDQGIYMLLEGRGPYRLVRDRWQPDGRGLPLDHDVALGAVGGAPIAWVAGALYVRDAADGAWRPREGAPAPTAAWASGANLLIAAHGDHGALSATNDTRDWVSLPPLDGVVELALTLPADAASTGALTARTEDHRLLQLPVTCERSP